ncbi:MULTISPECIES: RNA polymerase sigma factor [Brevibacterium]|uniref:RNA polymerase sigma factor n=1 Tax=Brevibacterium TaxID=1696 RepID=UPI001FE97015|nr:MULTISPECIES: DUF6596 domain-containing protein [Brevibacterium]
MSASAGMGAVGPGTTRSGIDGAGARAPSADGGPDADTASADGGPDTDTASADGDAGTSAREAAAVNEVLATAARESRSRIIALLASATGDIELAEDAVATAFERALHRWSETGIPDNPAAWLLTVARNHQRDVWKSSAHRSRTEFDEAWTTADERLSPHASGAFAEATDEIEDRRLALLFVCAHPAIDPAVRTPLMLQVVLGFEAADIARAFAVPTTTMAQRLVRAKRRIRDARIPFVVPSLTDLPAQRPLPDQGQDRSLDRALPDRLTAVLEAVYGCLAIAWAESPDTDLAESMSHEALFLARTLTTLVDSEPEVHGLAALVSFSLSRAPARGGDYVPVEEQDPADWDRRLIAEGERHLRRALSFERPGRFTLEAAMQAVHADRARTGRTDWSALLVLVRALTVIAPTLGARVARAAITLRADGAEQALSLLAEVAEDPAADRFQPYWATLAEALRRQQRTVEAAAAYERAIALTSHEPTARWLRHRNADL